MRRRIRAEDALSVFARTLTPRERQAWRSLKSPAAIQAFLDSIPYRSEEAYHCARAPLRDRRANCFDGALLAVAALRRLGHPLLMQLVAERDDEHLLALYKRKGHYGAVAKSNLVGLRYREPVYRSLRELAMSYFEVYFNVDREKSLRGYTRPIHLSRYDAAGWMHSDECMPAILERLDRQPRVRLVDPRSRRWLSLMDPRSFAANMQGVNHAGLYIPPPRDPGAPPARRPPALQG